MIDPPVIDPGLPATWCVVVCEHRDPPCDESWTVDVAEFTPPLTTNDVHTLLTPLLLAHNVEHGEGW